MSILNKKQFLIYNRLSIEPLYVFCIESYSTNTQPLQYFSRCMFSTRSKDTTYISEIVVNIPTFIKLSETEKTKLIGKALGKHLIDKNLILSYKTKLIEVLCHPQYIID